MNRKQTTLSNQSAAKRNMMETNRLGEALSRRTRELSRANRHLLQSLARRKRLEATLRTTAVNYTRLLKDSLRLQRGLRQLTHRVLTAHENDRTKFSQKLQDETVQTLLGIRVRLLSLKQKARANTTELKNEIASTQRMVINSARSVQRTAREFGKA